MEAYQNYLDAIIDSTYADVEVLVTKIKAFGKCPCCSGKYIDSSCKYCGYENSLLKQLTSSLSLRLIRFTENVNNLPIDNIGPNKLFDLLFTISELEITEVKNLLAYYNYSKIYNEAYKRIIQKLSKAEELSESELTILETLIKRKDSNINLEFLYSYFIHNAIARKQNIGYEAFGILITRYVEKEMKAYYKNPSCIIKPSSEFTLQEKERETLAQASHDKIWLSEEEVKALYYEGSTSLISSIYHELTHTMQYRQNFYGRTLNAYIIDEIREHILTQQVPNYYFENYDYITYELEAEYYGIVNAMEFLEKIGFQIDKNRHNQALEVIQNATLEKKRYVNGEETTVEAEFEKLIINHPELLDAHPQLRYLYKIEDGIVLPKSEDELISDYQNIVDDPNCSYDTREFYKTFYRHFLSFGRR